MLFVGIDLTDPYAKQVRPVTRAAMTETLDVSFSEWVYNKVGAGMVPRLDEVIVAIDGPQGLAKKGATMRQCERLLGTPGKTADHLPQGGPFAGFIRGSVELFGELNQRMRLVDHPGDTSGSLLEVYPGAGWATLSPEHEQLPKKTTLAGRQRRKETLETVGLRLPSGLPSHDELDAALAAYVAFCFRGGRADCVGMPPFTDDGVLREGFIIQPLRH